MKKKTYFQVHPNKKKRKKVFLKVKIRKRLKFKISCDISAYVKAMTDLANAMRCCSLITPSFKFEKIAPETIKKKINYEKSIITRTT